MPSRPWATKGIFFWLVEVKGDPFPKKTKKKERKPLVATGTQNLVKLQVRVQTRRFPELGASDKTFDPCRWRSLRPSDPLTLVQLLHPNPPECTDTQTPGFKKAATGKFRQARRLPKTQDLGKLSSRQTSQTPGNTPKDQELLLRCSRSAADRTTFPHTRVRERQIWAENRDEG